MLPLTGAVSRALLGGGAAAPVTLINDAFTDTNGVNLTAHTIAPVNVPAATWAALAGAITVQSNKASIAAGAGLGAYVIDAGVPNATVSAVLAMPIADANHSASVLVRGSNVDNYWSVQLTAALGFRLVERAAGVNTTRATTAFTPVSGVSYLVSVTADGNTITATVNGGNVIVYASATFNNTATKHGLRLNSSGAGVVTADNFSVTNP